MDVRDRDGVDQTHGRPLWASVKERHRPDSFKERLYTIYDSLMLGEGMAWV